MNAFFLLKKPVHHGGSCSFDGLPSLAGVHRSIENLSYWIECQQCTGIGGAIFKNSQKQRSRLEGVELDKPVSSIYSGPADVAAVQSVAAWGQQTFEGSLPTGVGSICSFGTFCPLISLCLHTSVFLNEKKKFTKKWAACSSKQHPLECYSCAIHLQAPLITAYSADKECTKILFWTEFHQFVLLINVKAAGQFTVISQMIFDCEGGEFMEADL